MATEITFENRDALRPLFKPHEEPILHRTKNPTAGGPALVVPGRRPSSCPLVRPIRAEVKAFRESGYAGVSETSRRLLRHWFESEHLVPGEDDLLVPFAYHFAQREAIETIIYLYESRGISSVASLLTEFGGGKLDDLAAGIPPTDDRWAKYCTKVATGGGKTKIMSLLMTWCYFHRRYEEGSELPQHFVLIAPNITVYERLRDDFEGAAIFHRDPLVPLDWKDDFQLEVVLQEESGGTASLGALYLTNIHRLYESRDKEDEDEGPVSIFGPVVKKSKALDTGESLRKRIASHPNILVMNDEAHHLHDPGLAWNIAIDTLDQLSKELGNGGVVLQVDFSATPRHNNGDLFRHIVSDFPLGEAVDAGIVKVPVLGESDDLPAVPDPNMSFVDRYHQHLQLGYQLYKRSLDEVGAVRKPILFVMTEDTDSAKEVARYLSDESKFPALGGKVLDVHTKVKGKLKKVTRNGKETKEFVEGESNLKPDELKFLRQLSRDLDAKDSPYRCVVSVLMLREGWDVKNVTTIVPLRAYSARSGILPEQTLGRGLRRMFPGTDIPEKIVVVHHPAFRNLYEQELEQEGLDIAVLQIREDFKDTVTIFVDHDNKPVEDLEIVIPLISDAVETSAEMSLSYEEVVAKFTSSGWPKLPVKSKGSDQITYHERHLFTDETIAALKLDAGLLATAATAVSYFVQMIGRQCKVPNVHATLAPLVENFIAEHLFERKVDLYGGEIDHRMRDADVKQYILGVFAGLVLGKVIHKRDRRQLSQGTRLSTWKAFQATSTEARPAVPGSKTMFNLVPCANDFEQAFADFLEHAPDVVAYSKNAGPQKLMIDYLKPDKNKGFYVPDFFARTASGLNYVIELKGKTDELVPLKAAATMEWCASSTGDEEWRYLYVPYYLFQTSPAADIDELDRACLPVLSELVNTSIQPALLPKFDDSEESAAKDRVLEFIQEAGYNACPKPYEPLVRQAVELYHWVMESRHQSFKPAFTCLLKPFDDLSMSLLVARLAPRMPQSKSERDIYFDPNLNHLSHGQANTLAKHQRWLQINLDSTQSMQRLGTFLFCLNYAQTWMVDAGGVWEDVRDEFASAEFLDVFECLDQVNKFRNSSVAHEGDVTDPEIARKELVHWIRTMCMMFELA